LKEALKKIKEGMDDPVDAKQVCSFQLFSNLFSALLIRFKPQLYFFNIKIDVCKGADLLCSDWSAVQSVVFGRTSPTPSALFCFSEALHYVWPPPVALW